MGKLLLMALGLLLSINIADITNSNTGKDIEYDYEEEIKYYYNYNLDVDSNNVLELSLTGNSSTGYEWLYQENYKGDLVTIEEASYIQDQTNFGEAHIMMLDGRGGTFNFRITPNKNSKEERAELKFVYRRRWESNNGIAAGTLVVTKDNKGNIHYEYLNEER